MASLQDLLDAQDIKGLKDLIEVEAIKKLKARYFRAVDTHDLEGWLNVFTDDAVMEFEPTVGGAAMLSSTENTVVKGKDTFRAWWGDNSDRGVSVHHGHMPEIDIVSPTEARGVWAMEALVESGNSSFHGFGHYWETYRKEGGEWRIAKLLITRLRFEQLSRLSKRPLGKG
jgi:ketosteroid isomerase-like protein